ncbi:hypothetical protein ITP53_41715 [Nonomuraea sp. K274]|uniref:Uncharacterized protein n=1 Tax=Nonomuraea cypriaca TaxID=1187855 RepID=A0A931AFW2_9ACTN|nr:hypothetical protein [Nonomuraea cypriaca]MBF8192091.1 hypothetical protein [Nonomuraea cypriaca]
MGIKEYQYTPELVEAVQVEGAEVETIVAWVNKYSKLQGVVGRTAIRGRSAEYVGIQTPEGMRRAYLGDYVCHDGAGAFWPEQKSIFERRFALLASAGE